MKEPRGCNSKCNSNSRCIWGKGPLARIIIEVPASFQINKDPNTTESQLNFYWREYLNN